MLKKYVSAFGVCLFAFTINAQNNDVARVLEEVEQNNNELKAFASLMESKKLEDRSSNNLNNPQFDAYYLPFGNHSTTDYTEYQISQTFEFPSVYSVRNGLIKKRQRGLELSYQTKKQDVLLAAKKYCLELIILNKTLVIEQTRVAQASQVFGQVKALFAQEQIGVLTFNKAKIAWLQEQFNIQKIELDRQNLLASLKTLNGGNSIALTSDKLDNNYTLMGIDALWSEKLKTDPTLVSMHQKETIALQELKLSKHKALPDINAGYNKQGFAGENYSGFYGGIAIPLFGNRNKVKAAQANFQFQKSYSNVLTTEAKATFERQYKEYNLLLSKYQEYKQTLDGLNSDALLLKAYELGEISFMEYYVELQFYRQAADTMLSIEKQLNLLKADLEKHQF
ncbi:MAG: cobalt-zinc-cadmium efflux system outer membrane protein [Luteibaculaceae bacterium]|jgi:cobalt-zinc-cadmium efflux system outer membrane protein